MSIHPPDSPDVGKRFLRKASLNHVNLTVYSVVFPIDAVVATFSEPVFLERLCSNPFQLFHKLESYTPCIHFLVPSFSSQTWNEDTRLVATRRLMHAYIEQSI